MISEMAKEDAAALDAEGVKLSFADVVRLNALGLKVERAAKPSRFTALPRVAFVGDCVFREPTIGDRLWMEQADRSCGDSVDGLQLIGYALGVKSEDRPDPDDAKAVRKAVTRFFWILSPAHKLTRRQLNAALEYAMIGDDPIEGEDAPTAENSDKTNESCDAASRAAGFIIGGVALRLGSISDIKAMTESEVAEVAEIQARMDGRIDVESEKNAAFRGYCRFRNILRDRKSEADHDATPPGVVSEK